MLCLHLSLGTPDVKNCLRARKCREHSYTCSQWNFQPLTHKWRAKEKNGTKSCPKLTFLLCVDDYGFHWLPRPLSSSLTPHCRCFSLSPLALRHSPSTAHILRMTKAAARTPARKTAKVCHVGVPKWDRMLSYKSDKRFSVSMIDKTYFGVSVWTQTAYPASLVSDPVHHVFRQVVHGPRDYSPDNIRNSGHQCLEDQVKRQVIYIITLPHSHWVGKSLCNSLLHVIKSYS